MRQATKEPEPRCWFCCEKGEDPTNIETKGTDDKPFYCRNCGGTDIVLTHFDNPFKRKRWYQRRWVITLYLLFCFSVGTLCFVRPWPQTGSTASLFLAARGVGARAVDSPG